MKFIWILLCSLLNLCCKRLKALQEKRVSIKCPPVDNVKSAFSHVIFSLLEAHYDDFAQP